MKKFIMMVGLPASGKSTIAKKYAEKENAIIISTDELREELLGDEASQENNELVFKEAEKRIKENLNNNKNVIFDATNVNYRRRMDFLNRFNKFNPQKIAILVATPYEECLERNLKRERVVPEEVITNMYHNFYVPQYYEGFNEIKIEYNSDYTFAFSDLKDIPQDNPHHRLSVLEHCAIAQEIALKLTPLEDFDRLNIAMAAALHDIGKLKTKSFNNKHNDVEIWKDIIEFQSRYEISSFGNVRNKKTQRILKPREHSGGYLQINVINNGKTKNYYIHQLVAKYFCNVPIDIKNKDVNHIDGNKKNNFYKNLEYCTRSENIKHSFYTNKNRNRFGEQIWNSKLTSKDIENINKIKKEQKISNKKIAEMYNISESQITRALNKKTYVNQIENQVKELSPILPQKYASFYNHEKVSAYDSLFYEYIKPYISHNRNTHYSTLRIIALIQWHMLLWLDLSNKSVNKYKKLLGEDFWHDLEIVHEADKEAH